MYSTVDELVQEVDINIEELNDAIVKAEKAEKVQRSKPLVLPTYGRITSGFGYRRNPFGRGYEFHTGIDIANSKGTPIKASGDGIVTNAGWESGYGYLVKINHQNGYESLYGHNSKILVRVGQEVERGQVIAYMGSTGRSTGNHSHFEVRLNGKAINPYDVK
jgi:murein DD-endopeptidase MepM/ murein hydrolase activator NlpD